MLVAPTGQNLMLMSDVGGTRRRRPAPTLTFADSAGGTIPGWRPARRRAPTVRATTTPTAADAAFPAPAPATSAATALSTFNGQNPNGVWQLFVVDDASGDSGAVGGGWCLNVSTAAPTTTALTSSVNPSTFGQSVTFTATVTSGATVNAGTVTFKDGATTLAANVAVNASGVATFTTSTLAVGFAHHHRHLQRHHGVPGEHEHGAHAGRPTGTDVDGAGLRR